MIISNVTYINMDHRIDKYVSITGSLQYCPFNCFKTSGIIAEDYLKYDVLPYVSKNQQKYQGIIGCFLAHINALEALLSAKNKDSEYSMIIEDDIVIKPKFWNFVSDLSVPEDADLVFFDSGDNRHLEDFPKYSENPVAYKNFRSSWPKFVGTHCYAVPNNKIPTIIKFLKETKVYKDIDGHYFGAKEFNCYCYQTGLTKINYKFKSDRIHRTWIS